MLNIDSIHNGIVLDHIRAGTALKIFDFLGLRGTDHSVAIIQNVRSSKYGKKDIIKIEGITDLSLDVLGYIDPNITVDIIHDGHITEKRQLSLPKRLVNIIQCKNPRCITSIEEECDHIFELTDSQTYRCVYCEEIARPI